MQPPVADEAIYAAIDSIRDKEAAVAAEVAALEDKLSTVKRQRMLLGQAETAIRTLTEKVEATLGALQARFDDAGLDLDAKSLLSVRPQLLGLNEKRESVRGLLEQIELALDPFATESLLTKSESLRAQREHLEGTIRNATQAYQEFRAAEQAWVERMSFIEGTGDNPDTTSQAGLNAKLRDLTEFKPKQLAALRSDRDVKCREIHAKLAEQVTLNRELTRRVQEHIRHEALTREKYKLTFDVTLVERDFVELFFNLVAQSSGSFSPVREGQERLQAMIAQADFDTADGVLDFIHNVLANLASDRKNTPAVATLSRPQLKKGATVAKLYDLLFSLQFLQPTFALTLNGKPLRQLSPGERGILLLVFYLVVDGGDIPLIIDQPEGNLNNQSIFEHLVPVFNAAKSRRQIIIVTHNPNLAVVCDAEQIIHCFIDIADGNRVDYSSGALENPKFNRLSLDLLEGTSLAFEARNETYDRVLGPTSHSS